MLKNQLVEYTSFNEQCTEQIDAEYH